MKTIERRRILETMRESLLIYAKRVGCLGFTVEELCEHVKGHPNVVCSRMNSLRISGRIEKLAGNEWNKAGTAKVNRYRITESVADEVLEKAAKEYTTLHPVSSTRKYANVDECIKAVGHDEDFEPVPAVVSTGCVPGSPEKMMVLASRVARGEELWHPDDPVEYHSRCTQVI